MKFSERPPAAPAPSRAPANGLKLMLMIAIVFALAVAYGQWQRTGRATVIHARITRLPHASTTPAPAGD